MGESQGVRNFGGGFDFTNGKMSFSALLALLVRQEALEEGAEHLFAKLRAMVCKVCVNQFLLLLVLVMGLARGHVYLYEGDGGQAQFGAIFMFFLYIFICYLLPERPH